MLLEIYVKLATGDVVGDTDAVLEHLGDSRDEASGGGNRGAGFEDRVGCRAVDEGLDADCAHDLDRGSRSNLNRARGVGRRASWRQAQRQYGEQEEGSENVAAGRRVLHDAAIEQQPCQAPEPRFGSKFVGFLWDAAERRRSTDDGRRKMTTVVRLAGRRLLRRNAL